MTDTPSQKKPATVAATPRQAGETTQRKLALSLGSSAVWTERMLDTLERGIEGGHWYSLIDKVWNEKHLLLVAWSGYFAGGNGDLYTKLDQWLRMRLRSILRKRERSQGRGRGQDHQRYPNVYFAEHGLITLNALTRAKRANPA